jgi:hypothetical protein
MPDIKCVLESHFLNMPTIATEIASVFKKCDNITQQDAPHKNKICALEYRCLCRAIWCMSVTPLLGCTVVSIYPLKI